MKLQLSRTFGKYVFDARDVLEVFRIYLVPLDQFAAYFC